MECPTCKGTGQTTSALRLDELRLQLWYNGKAIALTYTQMLLVRALLKQPGQVCTYLELWQACFDLTPTGWDFDHPDINLLKVHMTNLRARLQPLAVRLSNIRKVGYALEEVA